MYGVSTVNNELLKDAVYVGNSSQLELTGNIQHVVYPPCDPVVPVLIPTATWKNHIRWHVRHISITTAIYISTGGEQR